MSGELVKIPAPKTLTGRRRTQTDTDLDGQDKLPRPPSLLKKNPYLPTLI